MSFDFPQHYRDRVQRIREAAAALPNEAHPVILFGDSLSEGFPFKTLSGRTILNEGISGDEIYHPDGGLMNRLPLVFDSNPERVLVLIGTNDLVNSSKTPQTVAHDFEELAQALVSRLGTARVHFQKVLPMRGKYAVHMGKVNELNLLNEKFCAARGFTLLDMHTMMLDEEGLLRSDFTYDDVHLSPAAYEAWRSFLENYLSAKQH